jgi:hypothetical protein
MSPIKVILSFLGLSKTKFSLASVKMTPHGYIPQEFELACCIQLLRIVHIHHFLHYFECTINPGKSTTRESTKKIPVEEWPPFFIESIPDGCKSRTCCMV